MLLKTREKGNIACLNDRYDGDCNNNNNANVDFRCHPSSIVFVVVEVILIYNVSQQNPRFLL